MGSMHHVSLLIGIRSYLTAYVLACVTHAHTHIHVHTHTHALMRKLSVYVYKYQMC